ncbi:DNA repair and recombination protein RAD54B [Rhineura floridana]|uniref:DNA repair and recombination protein RAD54B n=1 Tax=Rhineura floridana TaxID=261503 RepID=UPI002AC82C29|nr:DNA repair and recombination protein RAD54B [Rhineura floridana]XP_061459098.1 DNA repair and recombination protein RAD54B [Rhineura floridana]XP_061459107.1 DNA repair and recombination protein RAD54B [Rhineura floridana]
MRRSAAPSQLIGNSAKKPRFIPPEKTHTLSLKEVSERLYPEIKITEVEEGPLNGSTSVNICSTTWGFNSTLVMKSDQGEFCSKKINGANWHLETGVKSVYQTKIGPACTKTTETAGHQEEPSCLTKYFGVVWCKASKKKHKKWEGDAVLIAKGKSVTLKDMEGRDIGRGTGYKAKDLENLVEGQTLMVGGKEIEVLGIITEEDFKSGKCFQSGVKTAEDIWNFSQAALKPFCNPFKNVSKPNTKGNSSKGSQNYKPRHDPCAPNCLVMPLPSPNHQRMFNKSGLPVVEVVVDPHIVNHLRPHQREGIIFLYECVMGMRVNSRFGAILADEMGLGKTLQCISLIWTLLRQGPYGGKPIIKQALIVTPGSLVKNWGKEFQKWLGNERIKVFLVNQDHKVEEFISSPLYPVLIISYEMFLRSLDQIQKTEFSLVICDEGHRLKNIAIKTTIALASLSCERRIILTGTPVQNDLQEFYALIEYVNPGILGHLSAYKKVYEEPIIRSREPSATKEEIELGERRAVELTRLTGLFILRRTQDVINKFLPPKKESILFCRPTALQLDLYRRLLSSQVVRSCLQGSLENSPHLICIGALKKLCNHPCLLFKAMKEKESDLNCDRQEKLNLYEALFDIFSQEYNPASFSETDSGKLNVLMQLLAAIHELSPTERVVVVSNYTQTLNILQEVCKRHGYSCTRLDGNTPTSQRQQIVDAFNSKFCPAFIFLLSSKAGGVGLNLVGASHLILYDIDWNPATDIQAMARVWRDGQKHTVHIYRLLTTGTIEEKIYQRQISKQGLSGAVVDFSKGSEHIRFSVEELKNLFILHEDSSCVTHDLLECKCMGKKSDQDPSENLSVQQDSQLGQSNVKSVSKKPLSMSQLIQWKHFCGDHKNLPDPFLERIKENITFIFQNVTC